MVDPRVQFHQFVALSFYNYFFVKPAYTLLLTLAANLRVSSCNRYCHHRRSCNHTNLQSLFSPSVHWIACTAQLMCQVLPKWSATTRRRMKKQPTLNNCIKIKIITVFIHNTICTKRWLQIFSVVNVHNRRAILLPKQRAVHVCTSSKDCSIHIHFIRVIVLE